MNLGEISFMAGPRYTRSTNAILKKHSSQLLGEALFGYAHGFDSFFPNPSGAKPPANSFSMQLDVDADIASVHGFALRVLEVDCVRTSFPNNGSNAQHDLCLAFGVSYHLGKKL